MVFARAKAGDGCCVMRHDTHGCGVPGWVVTLYLYGGITDDDSGGDGRSEGARREADACGMVRAALWPGLSFHPRPRAVCLVQPPRRIPRTFKPLLRPI